MNNPDITIYRIRGGGLLGWLGLRRFYRVVPVTGHGIRWVHEVLQPESWQWSGMGMVADSTSLRIIKRAMNAHNILFTETWE
jgi:hypothetical protein